MALQTTPTTVGNMYDQFTDLLTDMMGGYIHVGYWHDNNKEESIEVATDRLTFEVGNRVSPSPAQRILDVGCGTGKATVQIAKAYDVQVTGISVSNHQIELAQARSTHGAQVLFQLANAMELSFPDASYDGAYAIESLCHMHDRGAAIAQIARVLRPGSRFVVADILLDSCCPNPQGLTCFQETFQVPDLPSADDLQDLLRQAGFKVIEFTDIRENVLPVAKFYVQKGLAVGGEVGKKLIEMGSSFEQVKGLGYALITAERL
ncbi:hypothetical protein Asppvi_007035 [Aspergillus pseudoviridinutans]|uniref:Methyltransferase type 11 domain-containing protein n=1 Tax=Aspergillus pseudoviridinutans TaxID=1517512 RepID=A0A9P3EWK5_9EURO|nr:uncharacterized protein Asppvi_007035 [Aspergillus pseudoviridinutans]GIJ88118.1 hypothetical protein Asppvi_007035 [Aspergillus pseudoviridinutans]